MTTTRTPRILATLAAVGVAGALAGCAADTAATAATTTTSSAAGSAAVASSAVLLVASARVRESIGVSFVQYARRKLGHGVGITDSDGSAGLCVAQE